MFAIIKSGGKQYKVQKGQVVKLEKLENDINDTISFPVLAIEANNEFHVGSPYVSGANVECIVVRQELDKKVIVFKKRRRHNYRRKKGHRQNCSYLLVKDIVTNSSNAAVS